MGFGNCRVLGCDVPRKLELVGMRAWLREPGKRGHTIHVPNELEVFQQLVDGYIECVTVDSEALVICDEEGRLKDKPYNCTICGVDFVGTIVIVGRDGPEFDDLPMGWVKNLNQWEAANEGTY